MSPQAGFLLQNQIVPRLQSAIPSAVNPIGSEDVQELVQDGTCMAGKMMHNAELAGKKVTRSATGQRNEISAGNIKNQYYKAVWHLCVKTPNVES